MKKVAQGLKKIIPCPGLVLAGLLEGMLHYQSE